MKLSPSEIMLKVVHKDLENAHAYAVACLSNAIESNDRRWQKFQLACIQKAHPNNAHVQDRANAINAILAFSEPQT